MAPGADGSHSRTWEDMFLRRRLTHVVRTEDNPTMVRSWKCRLRMHKWDDRENPETNETYQVCLRCDAYREMARAALGAGAAGLGSAAFH